MKPYFGYIRVSTQRQGQGVSLQEQREAIEAHARRFGLTVTYWFEEKETAAKEGRTIFTKMVARLQCGEAQGVIIHKIDRGARNLSDWANLGKLFDRGIDVQFAHDSIDLRSRGGRLSADILAVVAADYVRNLRDEVKKGFYGRLKQGLYPLPAPVGYLDNGGGKLKTIDPLNGPLMRWAFERYAQGTISLEDLAADLNQRGLRPRFGGRISVQTLAQALRNPFYIGIIFIRSTRETFQGIHPPLVTKEQFDQVGDVLSGKAPRKAVLHDFAFRLFIRCERCGRHLSGERKKTRYVYYRCLYPRCRGAVLREGDVCAYLRSEFGTAQLRAEEIRDLRDFAERHIADERKDASDQVAPLRMRLGNCEERLSRLTDALVDGLIDKEAYEDRKSRLLLERRELMDRLENPLSALSPAQLVLRNLELPNIEKISHEKASPHELRKIAEAMTWNFTARGKKPEITLRDPFFTIRNWRLSSTVDRIVAQLELSQLHARLMEAAANDNDVYEVPNVPEVPIEDEERGTHGLDAAA